MTDEIPAASALSAAVEPLTAAAARGQYDLMLAEAERAFERLYPSTTARMVARTGGDWYEARGVEGQGKARPLTLPAGVHHTSVPTRVDSGVFVPIFPGALGLWVSGAAARLATASEVPLLRQILALAVQTCERQRIALQNLDEVQSLQRVVTRMLKSHDIGEILQLITREAKRLLVADICGVFLKADDSLVMKHCAGNRSPETATLRMDQGQGLAGLALAEARPVFVEDYLTSETISRDFFHLAEAERVRSALAVPLLGQSELIGVLEVWRRRPSAFTSLDTTRLVALANLASIALENAELVANQRRMVDRLADANAELNERYDTVRSVSALSNHLMKLLLQGADLHLLATTIGNFLRESVAVIALDGSLIETSGDGAGVADAAKHLRNLKQRPESGNTFSVGEDRWQMQPVIVEGETMTWAIARVGERGEAMTELASVQLATFTALHNLEQRAAVRARTETIDALVWDLLRGDGAARAFAADRAADLKLDLEGPLRAVLIELGARVPGSMEHPGSALRQIVARELAAVRGPEVRAIALQGPSIALIVTELALESMERYVDRATQRLSKSLEGRRVIAGASSCYRTPKAMFTAYREAEIALDVARQAGRSGAVVYDRAGVVGLLFSLRREAGMHRFLELNFGKLLLENEKQRDMLLDTLRVFFDVNCSHEAASQRLGVHRKTVANRVARISELTGLDFTTHDDRLVADLALYIYRMLPAGPDASAKASV